VVRLLKGISQSPQGEGGPFWHLGITAPLVQLQALEGRDEIKDAADRRSVELRIAARFFDQSVDTKIFKRSTRLGLGRHPRLNAGRPCHVPE
jgi:hypothetical protein